MLVRNSVECQSQHKISVSRVLLPDKEFPTAINEATFAYNAKFASCALLEFQNGGPQFEIDFTDYLKLSCPDEV